MPVNLEYPHAECPDCGEPIPDEAEAGDQCANCDHVFLVNGPTDDGSDNEDTDTGREFSEGGSGVGFNEE